MAETPAQGSDRRKEGRAPIELRVEYTRLNSFFADYTRNISRGGTFIRTDKPLPIGTDFMFKLIIPRLPQPMEIKGRVQWVVEPKDATAAQPPGMGIGFLFDSEADRQRIETEVEKLMVDSLGAVLFEKILGRKPTV